MELTVKGTQEFLGKQIPVIEGGFGEGQRCILVNDVSKIHGVQVKHINEIINKNIKEFEVGVDILDLKNGRELDHMLQDVGMTKSQITKNKNIYLLSESGYMGLCMLMKGRAAREIRKQFRREYFAMRATLATQAEYIKVLEENLRLTTERNMLLEDNTRLLAKNQKLNEIINTACQIPRKHLIKDIKVFLNEYTKNVIFGSVYKDEAYGVYLHSRRGRKEQPTRSQFEDIISSELGYRSDADKWFDIVWK